MDTAAVQDQDRGTDLAVLFHELAELLRTGVSDQFVDDLTIFENE